MTKRDLLSVAIRIVGVVLLLRAVEQLASGVYTQLLIASGTLRGFSLAQNATATLMAFLIAAVSGLVLLIFADAIGRLLVRQDKEASMPDVGANQAEWFGVAARVVGLVAVALGLPILVGTLVQAFAVAAGETANMALPDKFTVLMIALRASHLESAAYTGLVQIALGAYLIWGAEHFTRLVFRQRRRRRAAE